MTARQRQERRRRVARRFNVRLNLWITEALRDEIAMLAAREERELPDMFRRCLKAGLEQLRRSVLLLVLCGRLISVPLSKAQPAQDLVMGGEGFLFSPVAELRGELAGLGIGELMWPDCECPSCAIRCLDPIDVTAPIWPTEPHRLEDQRPATEAVIQSEPHGREAGSIGQLVHGHHLTISLLHHPCPDQYRLDAIDRRDGEALAVVVSGHSEKPASPRGRVPMPPARCVELAECEQFTESQMHAGLTVVC